LVRAIALSRGQSSGSLASLARQFGVCSRTVARWKSRAEVQDRSHVLHRLSTTMTAWEKALAVELCRSL